MSIDDLGSANVCSPLSRVDPLHIEQETSPNAINRPWPVRILVVDSIGVNLRFAFQCAIEPVAVQHISSFVLNWHEHRHGSSERRSSNSSNSNARRQGCK